MSFGLLKSLSDLYFASSIHLLVIRVKMMPPSCPPPMMTPLEKLSPIGKVNSTAKSKDTAIVDTIIDPCKKQTSAVSQDIPSLNRKHWASDINAAKKH